MFVAEFVRIWLLEVCPNSYEFGYEEMAIHGPGSALEMVTFTVHTVNRHSQGKNAKRA